MEIPPDLIRLEEALTPKLMESLKVKNESAPLKIAFYNPVDSLDIFFMLSWLMERGLSKCHVDVFTADQILVKKTLEGTFTQGDLEHYCSPQGLTTSLEWIRVLNKNNYQVDPRLILKIQFHGMDRTSEDEIAALKMHHVVIYRPVVSDSYEKSLTTALLPCYDISLNIDKV